MSKLKLVLKWFYGINLLIFGLVALGTTIFGGLLVIVAGLVALPPIIKLVEEKTAKPFPRPAKYGVFFGCLIAGITLFSSNKVEAEEVAFAKLPKRSQDSILAIKAKEDSVNAIAQEAEREAEATKDRKEKLEKGFNAWDGSHIGLTRMIKKSMADPDSYDHIETNYFDMGDHVIVNTKFRGANAFGGKVITFVKAKCDLDGNVIEVLEQY